MGVPLQATDPRNLKVSKLHAEAPPRGEDRHLADEIVVSRRPFFEHLRVQKYPPETVEPRYWRHVTWVSRSTFYPGVAPKRCLKISTAVLSASLCLSNDDISNSIRAIVAINPSSPTGGATGGSLLGLAGNSSGAAAGLRNARRRSESFSFDAEVRGQTHAQITNEMAVHRLPSSTLPSPILAVFAPPRILTIVRECSEVTGVSANDEKATGSFGDNIRPPRRRKSSSPARSTPGSKTGTHVSSE
jgi:hypothetical protein